MLAVCPSPRAAVSVSCSVVAVGGRLSAFAEKTPCHVPEPSDERPICVPCVPIVTFCTLVAVITLTNVQKVTIGTQGTQIGLSSLGSGTWQGVFSANALNLPPTATTLQLTLTAARGDGQTASIQLPVSLMRQEQVL